MFESLLTIDYKERYDETMKLNTEQQRAVDCNDKKILCLACAGAGKTQVLISRLWRLVSQDNVNPRNILCLTFTRAAAFEMRERYAKMQKQNADSTSIITKLKPDISTFHAFCYSLILHDKEVRQKLGYKTTPKILDPSFMKKYQSQAIIQANIKLPLKKLNRTATRSRAEENIYQLYQKAFRRLLMQANLITFDILSEDVCKLFYRGDESIQKYLDRYQHILIDEFQDTDYTQVRFMESFKDANWFCVGDALQNLYSFRGTSNEFIKNYSKDDSWTKIRMNTNYRSTKQICEYANKSSTYASPDYRIELVNSKPGEPVIDCHTDEYDYTFMPEDSFTIECLVANITADHETAILCRTNAEVDYITNQLQKFDINCSTSKKDFTAEYILRSCLDDEYMMDWLSTFLPSDKYANYVRLKTLEENPDAKWFIDTFGNTFWIRKYLGSIIEIRKLMLNTTQEKESIQELITNIIKLLDLNICMDEDYDYADGKDAIFDLIEIINESKLSEVYCGTVHSVKGLEFEDVIVVGVDSHHFRLINEDNKNIFYVAVTRAKERLTVLRV